MISLSTTNFWCFIFQDDILVLLLIGQKIILICHILIYFCRILRKFRQNSYSETSKTKPETILTTDDSNYHWSEGYGKEKKEKKMTLWSVIDARNAPTRRDVSALAESVSAIKINGKGLLYEADVFDFFLIFPLLLYLLREKGNISAGKHQHQNI